MKIITLPMDERLQQQLRKKRDESNEKVSLNLSDRHSQYLALGIGLLLTEGHLSARMLIIELRQKKVPLDETLLAQTCAEIEYYCQTGDFNGIHFLDRAS